jgi:catecholate siderophore receptor
VTVDHDLSKNWRLHDVARIEHYTLDRNNVLPTGVYLSGGGAFDGDLSDVWVTRSGRHILRHQNDLFDQLESVWSVDTGGVTHQILAGLEVARQTAGVHSAQYNESPVALIDPVLTDRPPGEAPSSLTYNAVASDTAGLYLQDQIAFTSHWKALVGARLDTFSVEQDTLTAPYADLRNLNRAFSPRAGLVWEPSTELSVYASAGRSFIPSGDGLSIAATNAALSPEETTSFEVGAKASLAGGLLSITTSVFQLERNISETNPLTEVVTNSGDQRSRGAEISATGHLSKRWSVSAAYSLLDARIVDGGYDSAHVLLNGLRPGLVPRNSATLFTAYELPCGLGFGGGAVSMGSRFTSNDDFVTIPAYTVLNGVVYYHRAHWLARLNINNMLNHRYYATAGEGTDATGQTVMPGAPLNLQGTVSWRF